MPWHSCRRISSEYLIYCSTFCDDYLWNNHGLREMTKRLPISFDRTIHGVNITEHGVKSYSKVVKLGPFQVTLNANSNGVKGSVSIPGTGLSIPNIKLI